MILVGAAYQAGALPVSAEAIEHAIRLNGVAVDANIRGVPRGPDAVHDAPARRPRPRRRRRDRTRVRPSGASRDVLALRVRAS